MVGLRAVGTDAGLGEFPQSTVAAVTVSGVGLPPAQDSLSPVGLSDVLLSVGGVGDQVDALHLRQRGLPIDIAVIGNHLPELAESQQYVVESGERFFVAVGDLEDRHSCRLGCASVPASRDVPFHDKSVRQGLQELGATQIEVAESRRALSGDFAVVLERPPQSGAPLTIGDDCTIGHCVMLHGCTIGQGSLIGIGATVLNHARIGRNCLVGAHALVTEGKEFPDNSLIVGAPAKVVRTLDEAALARLAKSSAGYGRNWQRFAKGLEPIG